MKANCSKSGALVVTVQTFGDLLMMRAVELTGWATPDAPIAGLKCSSSTTLRYDPRRPSHTRMSARVKGEASNFARASYQKTTGTRRQVSKHRLSRRKSLVIVRWCSRGGKRGPRKGYLLLRVKGKEKLSGEGSTKLKGEKAHRKQVRSERGETPVVSRRTL